MTTTAPKDRFDEIPATEGRVGAHRRPPAPHARAVALAWAALATGVIVLLGFIGLLVIDNRVQFNDVFTAPTGIAETEATPAVTPTAPDEPAKDALPALAPPMPAEGEDE